MIKFNHHIRSFKQAWQTILFHPFEHLINILVLALVITICAAGLSLNNSLDTWKQHNITYPQIMVYMDTRASEAEIDSVQKNLVKIGKPIVNDFKYISKQQALTDLQNDSRTKDIASDVISADNNPLPDMIIINTGVAESDALSKLSMQLEQMPLVEKVQIDINYANKISSLLGFAKKITFSTQILFILVLSLVIYNMIRLQMMLKSDAINVSRLIGASDSFIMRPLIHYAIWQVTLATAVAGGGIYLLTTNLNSMFTHFNNLFGNGFSLQILPLQEFIILWLTLLVFTVFTVFLAVRWVFRNGK